MNSHENAAVVVELVRQLREKKSWCGITHLQKAAYFLKTLTDVPLSPNFILYKHGPYASEFQNMVSHMLGNRLLERVPQEPPYGPSLEPGPRAHLLKEEYGTVAARYARQTGFVSDRLASKGVVELEKLGTALWVTRNTRAQGVHERAQEMVRYKPHIEETEAVAAIEELDEMEEAWAAQST